MDFENSRILHRSVGWKYDLSGPNDLPACKPCAQFIDNPPNKSTLLYLELARAALRTRGVAIIAAIFFIPICLFSLYHFFDIAFTPRLSHKWVLSTLR